MYSSSIPSSPSPLTLCLGCPLSTIQRSSLVLDSALLRDTEDQALTQDYLQDFFVVLALCNTVVLSRKTQDTKDGQWTSIYNAIVHVLYSV